MVQLAKDLEIEGSDEWFRLECAVRSKITVLLFASLGLAALVENYLGLAGFIDSLWAATLINIFK